MAVTAHSSQDTEACCALFDNLPALPLHFNALNKDTFFSAKQSNRPKVSASHGMIWRDCIQHLMF